MMADYKKLFATTLQDKLKRKIVGKVFVTVTKDDKLYIQLTRDGRDTEFRTFIDNLSERMLNGYSTEYAMYEVIKQYREFVKEIMEKKYFYND